MTHAKHSRITTLALTSALALALAGCGGGGSGSSSASAGGGAGANPPAPTVRPAQIQTTVPAATYAAGSEELSYYTTLNAFRAQMGLGLLKQSAALDTAAKNHAGYIASNPTVDYTAIRPDGTVTFRYEVPANVGYTGMKPYDRSLFAKYAGASVVEEYSATGQGVSVDGAATVKSLINTVLHREGLMNQSVADFGVALNATTTIGTVYVNDNGYSSPQIQASDYLGVYPVDGQTGLPKSMAYESPSAFADVTQANVDTATASPISVTSAQFTTLKAMSMVVTEAGTSVALDMRVADSTTTSGNVLPTNSIYFVGRAPFKANTKYNAVFKGTVNGENVTKSWSFVTGS